MNRDLRLKSSTDFERVRQDGVVFSHPLVVLFVIKNEQGFTRIGVAAGKSLGNAVTRNRIKRRFRAILQILYTRLLPGWDILVIARKPAKGASFKELEAAIESLILRAGLSAGSTS